MNLYIGFKTEEEARQLMSNIESNIILIPRSGFFNKSFLKQIMGSDVYIIEISLSSDGRLDPNLQSTTMFATYRQEDVIDVSYIGQEL